MERKEKIEIALTLTNLVAVSLFSYLTYVSTEKANSLERVDRTLTILGGFSSSDVSSSHQDLRNFLDKYEPEAHPEKTFEADLSIYQKFAPFLSQIKLLSVCYANSYCESEFIRDYACGSFNSIFPKLDDLLNNLIIKPSDIDPETAILIKDCEKYGKN